MRAVPEGQVPVRLPAEVEAVGVGVVGLVPPGGRVRGEQRLAAPDHHVADLDVLGGVAERELSDRRVVPQRLLDHGRPRHRAVQHRPQLLGVGEQGAHRVGDQVERGLVSGDQHQQQGADEFRLAEPVVLRAGGDEVGGEVVTGFGPLGGDHRGEQREQRLLRGGGGPGGGGAGDQDVGQFVQFVLLLGRQAEQFADHLHRQRVGEVLAQVERAVQLADPVEQGGGPGLDGGLQGGHPARGEGLGDESAQPPVVLAVDGDHAGDGDEVDQRPALGQPALPELGPQLRVLADAGVGEELLEGVVVGYRPDHHPAREFHQDRRAGSSEPGVLPVLVASEGVEEDGLGSSVAEAVAEAVARDVPDAVPGVCGVCGICGGVHAEGLSGAGGRGGVKAL